MYYVFYDTETTGANVRFDQVLQFAAILTDENFNEIETLDIRCRISPHVIPSVDALLVTGVTPEMLENAEMSAFEMACYLNNKMKEWAPAVFIGYNTIKFDEEIMRSYFWQNLLEPYITSTKGSLRADLLPVLRTAHTIDPTLFTISENENGNPSFKLDRLAPLNGFSEHNAHDALGDVRATIYMAKLIRDKRPDIWENMYELADPKKAARITEQSRMFTLLSYYGSPIVHQVTRLSAQPSNPKQICCFDLKHDPKPFLDMPADKLKEEMTKPDNPFQRIRTNAMPTIFETDTLELEPTDPTERDVLIDRLNLIHEHPSFKDNIADAMEQKASEWGDSPYIEDKIYDGFPSWDDKNKMTSFHQTNDWTQRLQIALSFDDSRIKSLALRLVFLNAPDVLPDRVRHSMAKSVIEDRLLTTEDVPWTTLPAALKSLEGREKTPEIDDIESWIIDKIQDLEERLEEIKEVEKQ